MDNRTTRRQFIQSACCTATLIGLGWGLAGCDSASGDDDTGGVVPGGGITVSGNTIVLDLTGTQARAVASAGGFLLIRSARTLVVNAGGTIRAYTSVCTHEGCDVESFQNNRLVCPCHGSQYDTSGGVVQGPATAPLRAFTVSQNGDTVTITTT